MGLVGRIPEREDDAMSIRNQQEGEPMNSLLVINSSAARAGSVSTTLV
jgi:hypothetical protein